MSMYDINVELLRYIRVYMNFLFVFKTKLASHFTCFCWHLVTSLYDVCIMTECKLFRFLSILKEHSVKPDLVGMHTHYCLHPGVFCMRYENICVINMSMCTQFYNLASTCICVINVYLALPLSYKTCGKKVNL